jgi:hypothetical protein
MLTETTLRFDGIFVAAPFSIAPAVLDVPQEGDPVGY